MFEILGTFNKDECEDLLNVCKSKNLRTFGNEPISKEELLEFFTQNEEHDDELVIFISDNNEKSLVALPKEIALLSRYSLESSFDPEYLNFLWQHKKEIMELFGFDSIWGWSQSSDEELSKLLLRMYKVMKKLNHEFDFEQYGEVALKAGFNSYDYLDISCSITEDYMEKKPVFLFDMTLSTGDSDIKILSHDNPVFDKYYENLD